MTFAKRERLRGWAAGPAGRSVLGWLASGGVLALTGPFGTYAALGLPARTLYWLTVVGLIWLMMELLLRQVSRRLRDRLPWPRIAVPLAGAALAVLPATAVVALANRIALPGAPGELWPLVWQVGLLLVVIALLFGEPDAPKADAADDPKAPARSSFHARLPADLTGRLLCLEQEDHYLRVHTTAGSALIHARMADAARELGGEGLRVHRSWWVARDAVAGLERPGGGRLQLRLSDGRTVPVGKTYRAQVRAALDSAGSP
jgi:DNA-binding LytR/AlgR family response regulator